MTKHSTIYVSQADIDVAMHGNGRFCPVAIALHRQGYTDPTVTRTSVKLPTGVVFELPQQARDRIKVWDKGFCIAPFLFDMDTRS